MSKELIERLRADRFEFNGDLDLEAADLIEQQQSWIASLEQNARDADRMYKELEGELAAAQAQLVKSLALIGELKPACDIAMTQCLAARIPECGYFGEIAQTISYVIQEFDTKPTDDSALRELLKAERERCAKVCDEIHSFHFVTNPAELCAINIRAMEDQR